MAFVAPLLIGTLARTAAIGSGLFAGALDAFALRLGASLLVSAASRALAKKPPTQGLQVTSRSAVAPRELVYGFVRKGGLIVFMDSNGSKRRNLDLIVVFATHRVKSIGNIYFDGRLAFAAGNSMPEPDYDGGGGPYAVCERRLGDDNQTAIGDFTNGVRNQSGQFAGGQWTAAHRLRGCAHIGLRLIYNPERYPNGLPNITADIEGKDDILDPRTGLRGYTANAALCLADYMSLARFGIGAQIGAADGISEDDLIEAANVCDETVAKPGGGTEKRYECNGVVRLDSDPKGIIEGLLTASAGTAAWQGAAWKIHAGAYRVPAVALTMDDARGEMRLTTRRSRSDNCNAVRGTFISPENDWQADDFPAYRSAAYLAEDQGELVWRDITLPFTTSSSCAQRLAKIELERTRRQQSVAFAGKLSAWRAATGETVTLTYDLAGFTDKPFEVSGMTLGMQDDGTIAPDLILQETSPLVYDWTASEAQVYAAAPRTNLPNAFDVAAPTAVTVTEDLYETLSVGGVKARATISWIAASTGFVAQYQVEERFGLGPWVVLGRTDALSYQRDDIAPGNWTFRVQTINQAGASSDFTESGPVEITGLAEPPVQITGLALQSAGGLAILEWTLHPDLDVRSGGQIVIRHSAAGTPSWANSVSMKTVPGNAALAVVPLKPGAYLLRAQDSTGNLGPETLLRTDGIQAISFSALTTLQEDATFTGAKTGVILDTGVLRLDLAGDFDSIADVDAVDNVDALGRVLPTGTYEFASGINFGSVKRCRLRSAIDLTVLGILDNVDTRPENVDEWINFDGIGGGEVDCVVEFRTTQTNPSGSPVWSDWGRVDNTEASAWGVQARAILTATDAGFTPAITQLRLIAEEAT